MDPHPFDARLQPFLNRLDTDDLLASKSLAVVEALLGKYPWPDATDLPVTPGEPEHLRKILAHHRPDDIVAYAFWLSDQGYLECAVIFLQLVPSLDLHAMILLATNLRKLSRYDDAEKTWDAIDVLAYDRKDDEMMAKVILGKGVIARHRGNLKLALWRFERTILDTMNFPATRGQAELNRGIVLDLMGEHPKAAEAFWAAWELLRGTDRLRALTSVGISLRQAGHFQSADRAFAYVEEHGPTRELRVNAQIERLDVASLLLDKQAIRRLERVLADELRTMTPTMECDYLYRLGLSVLRQFTDLKRAHRYWNEGLSVAREHHLGKWQHDLTMALETTPPAPVLLRDERLQPIHSGLLALA